NAHQATWNSIVSGPRGNLYPAVFDKAGGVLDMSNSAFIHIFPVIGRSACIFLTAVLYIAAESDGQSEHHLSHSQLLTYLDDQGHERSVVTVEDWAHRRKQILEGMQEVMGTLPDRSHLPPLDVK